MSGRAAVAIGARLAFGAARADRVRLGLTAVGVGLGVAFVLGGLAVAPASAARWARTFDRAPADTKSTTSATGGVVVESRDDLYAGRPIHRYAVATVGDTDAAPPGLDRTPRPGELAVSPAFARLLAAPESAVLRDRYPGRVVATIRPPGLRGPRELVVWEGVPRSAVSADWRVSPGFGERPPDVPPVTDETRIVVGLAVVGFLVPVLVLVATATRLDAAARDRRLAALRLVGATPRQTRLAAATEAALVAAVGGVVGLGLLTALRHVLAPRLPVDGGVWPADLTPPPLATVAVLLAVPFLAAAVAVLALRRVVASPLGVSRQAGPRHARPVRLVPVALGLALLVAARVDRVAVTGGAKRGAVLLLGGAALTIVGLAVAAPLLATAAAGAVTRFGGPPALQLGARRVQADPGAAARVVTGSALVVFVGGWLFAFLPLMEYANTGYRSAARYLRPGTVLFQADDAADAADAVAGVAGVDGVTGVVTLRTVLVTPAGAEDRAVPAAVVDCAALGSALTRPLAGCAPGVGYGTLPGSGPLVTVDTSDDGTPRPLGPVTPPARIAVDPAVDHLNVLGIGGLVLPPESVPPGPPEFVVVATDGTPETVERVRTAAARSGRWFARTLDELVAADAGPMRTYRALTIVGLVAAGALAACSLTVTSVDAVLERRRSLAVLVACGTPVGVLRRAVLAQTALSLLPAVAAATATSMLASSLYLSLGDEPTRLPWGAFAALAGGAVAAVAAATLASLPAVGGAVRPEGLRAT